MDLFEIAVKDDILHILAGYRPDPMILNSIKEEFIFHLGRLEHEGVETLDEVKSTLKQEQEYEELTNNQRATLNMFHAWELQRQDVESSLVNGVFSLTLDHVNKWHSRILFDKSNTSLDAGKFRTIQVYSGHHWYPEVNSLEDGFQLFLTGFNKFAHRVSQYHPNTLERLDQTIKWAEWSLVFFLALHPYSDGNGRIGRLLCDYVLSSFFPFSIPAFNTSREAYLITLIRTQSCPCNTSTLSCLTYREMFEKVKLGMLASIILEWCWDTCCYTGLRYIKDSQGWKDT